MDHVVGRKCPGHRGRYQRAAGAKVAVLLDRSGCNWIGLDRDAVGVVAPGLEQQQDVAAEPGIGRLVGPRRGVVDDDRAERGGHVQREAHRTGEALQVQASLDRASASWVA